jgi:hypothetical protein
VNEQRQDKPDRPAEEPDARRLRAARHLMSTDQMRETASLVPQRFLSVSLVSGAQAALVTLIALPLVLLSPWASMIGFASLGALAALFGRFAPIRQRDAIVAQCGFWLVSGVFIMSLTAWMGMAIWGQLLVLAALAGVWFSIAAVTNIGPPGALIFVFAGSAGMAPVADFGPILERSGATAAVAVLAWLTCKCTEGLRDRVSQQHAMPVEAPRPIGHVMIAGIRVAIGAGLASFAALWAGAEHPAWAAMGAMAVLQGAHLHINMSRAIQRMIGTILGASWVWFILSLSPSPVWIIALLVCLIVMTEVLIGINYALGQILVTPMALLMTYLATPAPSGTAMVLERMGDTVLGACLGMILALIWSTWDERAYLATHHAARSEK